MSTNVHCDVSAEIGCEEMDVYNLHGPRRGPGISHNEKLSREAKLSCRHPRDDGEAPKRARAPLEEPEALLVALKLDLRVPPLTKNQRLASNLKT